MDFESIVEGLLLEVDEAPQASSAATEEAEAKTVAKFFEGSKYNKLQTAFNTAYGKRVYRPGFSVFPNQAAFTNLVYNASQNSIRDTKKPGVFPDFIYIFPLLDIISQVKAIYVATNPKENPTSIADKALDRFLAKLEKYKDTLPMDYNADDAWATSVKEAFINSNKKKLDVGSLKLPAFANYSLHYTIFKLLEQRKLSYSAKIQIDKLPKTNEVVETVLFNPDAYTSAEQVFPDLKLKSFYHGVTPSLLLSVAKSVNNLFEQQLREKLRNADYDKIEANAGIKKQALEEFYKDQLDWKKYSSKQASPQEPPANNLSPVQSSFDDSFKLLSKQMLNEITDPAIISRVKANVGRSAAARQTSKFGSPKPDQEQEPTKNDRTNERTFVDNKYTVGEVIKYANQKVTAAEEVHDSLSKLADHIRTEVESNLLNKITNALSKATQIAQAAMFGTKMAGT